jgi:hypothetical protein
MPNSPQPFTRTTHAQQTKGHSGLGFTQGALIHMGAILGAKFLAQQTESRLAKSLIYSACIAAASWATKCMRQHQYQHERQR